MCLVPPSGSSKKKKRIWNNELDVTYWLHQFSPGIVFLLWYRNNLKGDIQKLYYFIILLSCISCCDLIQTPPDVWRCVSRQTINWTHKYPWGGGWMLLPFSDRRTQTAFLNKALLTLITSGATESPNTICFAAFNCTQTCHTALFFLSAIQGHRNNSWHCYSLLLWIVFIYCIYLHFNFRQNCHQSELQMLKGLESYKTV